MKKILCVCLGNICRSPAAEGILRKQFLAQGKEEGKDFMIDSAGTGDWHVGYAPDKRSQAVCDKYGIDISNLKARKIREQDGSDFDLILGMDCTNLENIKKVIPQTHHEKIYLFDEKEVNDPYYAAIEGFEIMYQQLEQASKKFI